MNPREEIQLRLTTLRAELQTRTQDTAYVDDIHRLTRICLLLADELERVDKAANFKEP